MGTTYCLVNTRTEERYELDKGSWSNVFPHVNSRNLDKILDDDMFHCRNPGHSEEVAINELYRCILRHVAQDFDRQIQLQWFYDLAQDIVKWSQHDEILFMSDEYFYDIFGESHAPVAEKCPVTGSRFQLKGRAVEYSQEI
jgi:hypothetical protein